VDLILIYHRTWLLQFLNMMPFTIPQAPKLQIFPSPISPDIATTSTRSEISGNGDFDNPHTIPPPVPIETCKNIPQVYRCNLLSRLLLLLLVFPSHLFRKTTNRSNSFFMIRNNWLTIVTTCSFIGWFMVFDNPSVKVKMRTALTYSRRIRLVKHVSHMQKREFSAL
jgi:hypothetical protein